MKCHQCEKPAMFLVGEEGSRVPLCLDCNLKLVQTVAAQNDMLVEQMNYLTDAREATSGLSGILPRIPRRNVVQIGDITLNNIKVDRSVIGVLNTGTIQTVDSAVTALRGSGEEALGSAITELSQAILSTPDVPDDVKTQMLEILSFLSTEATAPKEKRRATTMRTLWERLASLISDVDKLIQTWDRVGPILKLAFDF